jgi:hypothetical protein
MKILIPVMQMSLGLFTLLFFYKFKLYQIYKIAQSQEIFVLLFIGTLCGAGVFK